MPTWKQALRHWFPKPVAYAAYLNALFENEIELRLLPCVCDRSRVSIDVGAFTGTYTMGTWAHSKSVIAVEPQPNQAAALRRSMPRGVRIVEAALSDVTGEGRLEMEDPKGGSMSRISRGADVTGGWVVHPVRLMRMDDLTCDRVGFVKIDAEGHELQVLEGGRRLVEADRPNFVIEAEDRYSEGAVDQLVRFFGPFDYAGYFLYRGGRHPINEFEPGVHQRLDLVVSGPRCAYEGYINNFIFVPRERATIVPHRVPSAWQAAGSTIAGWARKELGRGTHIH